MQTIEYKFNEDKSLQLILYILQYLSRCDFHQIFKILYFSDREGLAQYGMPLTGDRYIAMEAGPVPSNIYDIFKMVKCEKLMPIDKKYSDLFEVVNKWVVKPLQKPNMQKISKVEKKILDDVIKKYGECSFEELKTKSHEHAWNVTSANFPIKFEDIAEEAGVKNDEMDYIRESAIFF